MQPVFYVGLFITLILVATMLLVAWLLQRKRKSRPAEKKSARQVFIYIARLVGFLLLTILVIAGGTMTAVSYQTILADTAPAPSEVEIPSNLPFSVEEVTFTGGDGLTMAGWYVPSQNGATVILLHGYGGNRTAMLWHMQVLVEAGYGVLAYDERASGESEGESRSYGWEDPEDVGGAIIYLDSRSAGEVGIAGCSIGGQIAIQSAAYYPELEAVWADGPGTVTSKDIPPPNGWFVALTYPSNLIMDQMMASRLDRDIPPAIVELIGTIEPRPVMLVAGGQPNPLYGPESWLTSFMYDHAGEHAQLWVIPEATHCDGPIQRPEEYADKMVSFFDAALGIER